MSYWFEEPYQSLSELQSLYKKHLHDESERRFIIEVDNTRIGIVELVEINFVHSNCEIQALSLLISTYKYTLCKFNTKNA